MIKNYFKLAIVILFCCFASYGQQINRIQSKCPSPYQLTKSQVSANSNGDILYIPCTGRSSIFSGIVDFSGATITGAVTGSGTVNYVPRWLTSTNNLANTPLSWNGTTYNFNNTALTSTFPMNLTPTSGTGIFNVGNTASSYLALNQATAITLLRGVAGLQLNSDAGITIDSEGAYTAIGDVNEGDNGTIFSVNDLTNTFTFDNINSVGILDMADVLTYQTFRTISEGTGAVSINKPFGTVNFAAGASSIVVTNNTVSATSLIFCTVQSLDATAISCRVTDKGSNTFTIRVPAATGTTSVAFWVTN